MRAEYIDFTRNRAATEAAARRRLMRHIQSALISRLRAAASPKGEAKETL